ncbi:MAG: AI-2E family transporter YdiK [Phycisphaerales bacterium]
MNESTPPQITRITLQVLSIGLLIGGALWILQPFMPSILWATIIVVTTWPLLLRVQKRLWGRRSLAVAAMIGAILLIVMLPCAIAIGSIVSHMDDITASAVSLKQIELPAPPSFLGRIPLVGARMVDGWQKLQAMTSDGLSKHLAPYSGAVATWFLSKAGSVGMLVVQFIITMLIAAVMYAQGESVAETVHAFCRRLAGARGEEIATLAAKATRSVALGVVVTALVQTILSGIGLAFAGMPSAALLTAIILVLCLCQVGPVPILIPAIIWLYWRGDVVSATVLLVFAVIALPLDNFLRPILIRQGADMPLILVFIGVIGGLVAMGIVGLFIGPVILAVVLTLLKSWIGEQPAGSSRAESA